MLPLLLASTLRLVGEYTLTSGFDLAATEWALAANSRAYEANPNPFMQTRGRRLAVKSIQVAGLTLMSHKLKRKHPKLERVLRWTAHGVNFGLGAWAIHQGRRRP